MPALHVFNNAAGTYTRVNTCDMNALRPADGWYLSFADANQDGRPYLCIGDAGHANLFMQEANGTFAAKTSRLNYGLIFKTIFLEANRDGKMDAVILDEASSGSQLTLYRGGLTTGGSTFFETSYCRSISTPAAYFKMFPFRPTDVETLDFDSNGIEDVRANALYLHANPFAATGASTQELVYNQNTTFADVSIRIVDLTQDRRPDILIHYQSLSSTNRNIYLFLIQGLRAPTAMLAQQGSGVMAGTLNPAKATIDIFSNQAGTKILRNAMGRTVRTHQNTLGLPTQMQITELPHGIYLLSASGMTKRMVLE